MASRGINKAVIVGNLGQDPEVRYTSSSNAIANISVATSESWKDQQGVQQEKTEWHRIVFFGKLAEVVGEYLRKGSQVYIEGKLQTRKWTDNNGQDRYTTEIVVDQRGTMQMLGGQGQSNQQHQSKQSQPQQPQQPQQQGGYQGQPQQGGYQGQPQQSGYQGQQQPPQGNYQYRG